MIIKNVFVEFPRQNFYWIWYIFDLFLIVLTSQAFTNILHNSLENSTCDWRRLSACCKRGNPFVCPEIATFTVTRSICSTSFNSRLTLRFFKNHKQEALVFDWDNFWKCGEIIRTAMWQISSSGNIARNKPALILGRRSRDEYNRKRV